LQTQLIAKLSQIEKKGREEEKFLAAYCKRYSTDDDAKDQLDKIRLALVKCQQMKECCLRWSNEPFLQEVRPLVHGDHATQILLKNPTYNRFYRLYLRFQQHLKITRDAQKAVEELSLRKVSSLYELWSVFQISKMVIEEFLEAGYRMISNTTFFELEKDYFQFDMRKNVSSIVLARGDLEVRLKYEPLYPNHNLMNKQSGLVAAIGGTNPLKPDLAVEVYQGGQPRNLLIFDAKYKRAKEHGRTVPTQEDINTMYKYLASILWQTYKEGAYRPHKLEQIVSYACILYPGNELHQEGINLCVRALPLVPDLSLSLRQEIRQTLKELLHQYI